MQLVNYHQKIRKNSNTLKLCKDCCNCKTKNGKVFCKEGNFAENSDKSIIYIPFDFDCYEWEEG